MLSNKGLENIII